MAPQAVFLQPFGVHWPYAYRFREIPQREFERMIPAVIRFGNQLGNERMRRVAVIADGPAMVAGFLPRFELIAHDVAVCALVRIVAEVGEAIGKLECEHCETERYTQNSAD